MRLEWAEFKEFITSRNVPAHEHVRDNGGYLLQAYDGPVERSCKLSVDSSEYTDYVINFKPISNKSYTDSDGNPLSRTKITKTGWHYQGHAIEFTTSKLGSGFNKDRNCTDLGFFDVKFYDSQSVELTTQQDIDTSCVRSVATWEPTENIEVLGGILYQSVPATSDVRLWVTAVPDIPAAMGGSVPFIAGGVNLRHINCSVEFDGKAPKGLTYIPGVGTTKFETTCHHTAGVQHPIHMIFRIFRLNQ